MTCERNVTCVRCVRCVEGVSYVLTVLINECLNTQRCRLRCASCVWNETYEKCEGNDAYETCEMCEAYVTYETFNMSHVRLLDLLILIDKNLGCANVIR